MARRADYYRRTLAAYVLRRNSHLTFWHSEPAVGRGWEPGSLDTYYMDFSGKADYEGPFDNGGVPLLDYQGAIGPRYNPIAIAQYGLGNLDAHAIEGDQARLSRATASADWLVANLHPNPLGSHVWTHDFDWEYSSRLTAPWYSGLAQGQGISLLVRMHRTTGDATYLECARRAFGSFTRTVAEGGVVLRTGSDVWIEEYIVDPPTHILNGWIWAAWGVHDYFLATQDTTAHDLFETTIATLARRLDGYDTGYWSLYERSPRRMKMVASPFYHRLHIVQLGILHRLTGHEVFASYATRWAEYQGRPLNRKRALAEKLLFKLCYY